MKYVDWVDRVARAAGQELEENPDARMVGVTIAQLVKRIGLPVDVHSPEFHGSAIREAFFDAAKDLEDLNLVEDVSQVTFKFVSQVRSLRDASLRVLWPSLVDMHLEKEQLEFLVAACGIAEDDLGDAVRIKDQTAEQIYAELGWEWNDRRLAEAYDITKVLEDLRLIWRSAAFGGHIRMHPTYRGIVRATERVASADQQLIEELRDAGEVTTVEFKERLSLGTDRDKSEFVRDVLGLANVQARGQRFIVVGFEDETLAFTDRLDPGISHERIELILHAYSSPTPEVRFRRVQWEAADAGVIEVLRDPAQIPYRATKTLGRLTEGQVYVRHGRHTTPADPDEVADLVREGERARVGR